MSDFWCSSPKFDGFLPQNSAILPIGVSHNDKKHSKHAFYSSKQTYLPITNHFGGHRGVPGKLLCDFWSTSPKFDDFWPQISPILPTGAPPNDKKHSKYVLNLSKQTYLSITNHFGGLRRVYCKILIDFWSTSPKSTNFGPKFRLFCPLELHLMIKNTQNMF